MKRKIIHFFILTIIVTSSFLGCAIKDGNSYQKYYWTYEPLYIYDTNPYTPYTIYNDEYFFVEAGSYYMEYTAWNGIAWYMYYTIKKDKGMIFDDGDDYYYSIGLYSSGPSIYRYVYKKDLDNGTVENSIGEIVESTGIKRDSKKSERERGPIIGSEEIKARNGTVKIEYGLML